MEDVDVVSKMFHTKKIINSSWHFDIDLFWRVKDVKVQIEKIKNGVDVSGQRRREHHHRQAKRPVPLFVLKRSITFFVVITSRRAFQRCQACLSVNYMLLLGSKHPYRKCHRNRHCKNQNRNG